MPAARRPAGSAPPPRSASHRRAAVTTVTALLLALAACSSTHTHAAPGSAPTTGNARGAKQSRTVLQATLEPWSLPAPVSRAVVLPAGGRLLIAGGLAADNSSSAGIYTLDLASGHLSQSGRLVQPLHDAAGTVAGGRFFEFGGGAATTVATVQTFPAAGDATKVGTLPQPRSDLAAVTLGGQMYVLGGYDGTSTAPAVLRTTDGHAFTRVADLPVPVRYSAVAATGGAIYVFGGEHGGRQVDDVQRVDPGSGSASIVGHLPHPLSHATAAVLDGTVVVAGGRAGGGETTEVWTFDPRTHRVRLATRLPHAVADAGGAVAGGAFYLVGGEDPNPVSVVQALRFVRETAAPAPAPVAASPHGAPFRGELLIADRGNNRLLIVDARHRTLWRYPSATAPAPPGGFYFPDDAFFVNHGTAIITNEEENHTIIEIAYPSGRLLWMYGHPHTPGSAPGYLNQPDDAYLLRNGTVVVADALNCRVLFLRPGVDHPVGQIGQTGRCVHDPPTALAYPNGDTPLANGDILISEVNGTYVTEVTATGRLVWTVHLPIGYPSDPQQLGPDLYLVANYAHPGGMYEFNREGRILWSYAPTSGHGEMNHPSLAERLPNGLIAANDDYRHRVVIIDPRTNRIVWQYGHDDVASTITGYLNTPDGFDLLSPDGSIPTHPQTA